MKPVRVTALKGRVTTAQYGKGTKSEHSAHFLETSDGKRFVLRRKKGPAFADPEIAKLQGLVVKCDGFLMGDTLLAEEIAIVN